MRRWMILLLAVLLAAAVCVAVFATAAHSGAVKYAGQPYASAITASQVDLEDFFAAMDELPQEQQNACVEITPEAVSEVTDWRIFTVEKQYSFLLADGEVHTLCGYWGGWGVTSALPWDYDGNGVLDLLYTYSWGSGIHRSHVAIFDMTAGQEIMLTAIYAEYYEDAVVLPPEPDAPDIMPVCLTEKVFTPGEAWQFVLKRQIGEVLLQEGIPVYRAWEFVTPYTTSAWPARLFQRRQSSLIVLATGQHAGVSGV